MILVSLGTAERWLEEFAQTLQGRTYRARLFGCLQRYQAAYERHHPGRPFIETLDRTDFMRQWLTDELGPEACLLWLRSLRGLARWLLLQGRTEVDVIFYVGRNDVLNGTIPELWLRRSLQPSIVRFVDTLRRTGYRRSERCATAAHHWNLFRNRPEIEQWAQPELEEECWLAWMAVMTRRAPPCPARCCNSLPRDGAPRRISRLYDAGGSLAGAARRGAVGGMPVTSASASPGRCRGQRATPLSLELGVLDFEPVAVGAVRRREEGKGVLLGKSSTGW